MIAEYEKVLPIVRSVARDHGYAIGLHGSGARDLDLIAAPWTEHAVDALTLVEAVRAAVNGILNQNSIPYKKPHGRLAWVIFIEGQRISTGGAPYIDLSVMPRAE